MTDRDLRPPGESLSEAYLVSLAERTFLKPWTIANPFRKPGQELSDLIVPFGRDVLVFSDKACRLDLTGPLSVGWERWHRAAVLEGVKQLGGAVRRLEQPGTTVFTDSGARSPLWYELAPAGERTYHLINVARPHWEPGVTPDAWPGLTWSDRSPSVPFTIGPLYAQGRFVHVFDGLDLDLILGQLDTLPDLVEYLSSRERTLTSNTGIAFRERDLLASATKTWVRTGRFEASAAALSAGEARPGAWESYASSDSAAHTLRENAGSYVMDRLVHEFHCTFLAGVRSQDPSNHERAMRMLAREGRFQRRIIASALKSILDEPDQTTFWASTVPSPTDPNVRYLWLAYPKRAGWMSEKAQEEMVLNHLRHHLVVAADAFQRETTFIGVAWPHASAEDNLLVLEILDAERRTPEMRAEAEHYRTQGVFADLQPEHFLHMR